MTATIGLSNVTHPFRGVKSTHDPVCVSMCESTRPLTVPGVGRHEIAGLVVSSA